MPHAEPAPIDPRPLRTAPGIAPDIARTLGLERTPRGRARVYRWAGLALLLALLILGVAGWMLADRRDAPRYRTEPAQRGTLTVTVTATGTLKPLNQVDVGSELSGVVQSVAADYNDRVEAGQVLARLDDAKLAAQLRQSQAALESARARVLQAEATVSETLQQLTRLQALIPSNVVSQQALVAADAGYQRALAERAVARADVARTSALLNADRIALDKTVIRSPIDGIVLSRAVEPGQTVAAALQAPVLFTLAEDLRRMELSVDVDEADVGQVRSGQSATFTVDAYPERVFIASVTQLRYAPRTVAGVVTYEGLLAVDNAELLLRPGMTATADVVVATVSDALLVPNAALRFTPPSTAAADGEGGSWWRSLVSGPPRTVPTQQPVLATAAAQRVVWTLRAGQPLAIPVGLGPSDGRLTALTSGEVIPGTALLVDLAEDAP